VTHQCGHAECQTPAVVQWARRATAEEAGGVEQVSDARRAADVERARDLKRSVVHELKRRISLIPHGDPHGPGMRARLEAQIEDVTAELDAIADPAPRAALEAVEPTTVAVFGCEQHALDVDAAAVLHDADCAAPAAKCRCAL
jgi:hypothetical protein